MQLLLVTITEHLKPIQSRSINKHKRIYSQEMVQPSHQRSTYSRMELSDIPVYIPKQRYDIYSRNWSTGSAIPTNSTTLNESKENENIALNDSSTIQTKRRTWCCLIMSILFTMIFYILFVGFIPIIAYMIYLAIRHKFDNSPLNRQNGTNPLVP
jgi:hypothetical protein